MRRRCWAVSLRFGNCNNGANCGGRYLNFNNTAGNANWNIGSAWFYQPKGRISLQKKPPHFLHRWPLKHGLPAMIGLGRGK